MRIFPILVCACFLTLTGCIGSSTNGTLDAPSSGAETQTAATQQGKIEIPVGAPASRVLRDLGPADATDMTDNGREMWRYTYKRAEYVYVSNTGSVQTLVLGKYIADPAPESPGHSLLLTIVFDQAKKVADFNFAIMPY